MSIGTCVLSMKKGSELRKDPRSRKVDNSGPVLRKVSSTVPIPDRIGLVFPPRREVIGAVDNLSRQKLRRSTNCADNEARQSPEKTKLCRSYLLCGYNPPILRFMPSESNLSSNEARNDASTASCVFRQLNDLSGQCPRFERTIVTFLVAPVDRRVI